MVKLLCCLAVAVSTQAGARPPMTRAYAPADVFAIYLVADPVDGRITAYGRGDWSQLKLAASPLITGDDLISYEWSTHTMRLRREALARIPRPPVQGTPFVMVANGQRVYLGAFVTIVSSMPFAVPTISIDAQMVDPAQPADTLVIQPAYPSPSFSVGADPRGDERIKKALTGLGKIRGSW